MLASWLPILLYAVALGWVVWRGRSVARSGDMFNIFGRRAQTFRAASGYLSLIGAGELITISQLGFDNGLYLLVFPGGIACGFLFLGAFGARVRDRAASVGATTMAGYVTATYGRPAGVAMALAYTLSLGALLTVQFIIGGQLLAATAGIPPHLATILIAAVILFYLEIGGLVAVLSTDILRAVFMTVILVVLVLSIYFALSPAHAGQIAQFTPLPPLDAGMLFVLGFFGAVCAGDVWQTILASESRQVIGRSMVLAAIAFVALGLMIGLLGMAAKHVVDVIPADSSALVVAVKSVVPVVLVPLVTVLIAGAIMATADTEIWVVSTTLVTALGFAKPQGEEKAFQDQLQRRSRLAIPVVTIIAVALSYYAGDAQVIYNALLGLLTALAPAVLAIIFGANQRRAITFALWSSLLGFVTINVYWSLQPPLVSLLIPIIVSAIVMVATYIVSRSYAFNR